MQFIMFKTILISVFNLLHIAIAFVFVYSVPRSDCDFIVKTWFTKLKFNSNSRQKNLITAPQYVALKANILFFHLPAPSERTRI